MDTLSRLRAMASLCRQTAAHHPDRSWKLLAEAEFWGIWPMMRCAISHAHLPSRSQQLEMMRTPRNRPTVGRHERFRYQVPLTVTASSHSLQSVLF